MKRHYITPAITIRIIRHALLAGSEPAATVTLSIDSNVNADNSNASKPGCFSWPDESQSDGCDSDWN